MKARQVFRADELQVVDAGASGVMQLPHECRIILHLVSAQDLQVRAGAGPVEALLGVGKEVRLDRDLEGFDTLLIVAGKAPVSGWASVAERRAREVLDPTPVRIVTAEEYEQSLTVDQMIRRELARYHRARLDHEGDPDDGLEFDDEADELDLPEADDDGPPGGQGELPEGEAPPSHEPGGSSPEPAPAASGEPEKGA
nr:MAG: hypothetical protein [Microvirus sp.]